MSVKVFSFPPIDTPIILGICILSRKKIFQKHQIFIIPRKIKDEKIQKNFLKWIVFHYPPLRKITKNGKWRRFFRPFQFI